MGNIDLLDKLFNVETPTTEHYTAWGREQEIREDLSFNSKTALAICVGINSVSSPEYGNKEKQRCVPVPSVHSEKEKQLLFLSLLLHFSNNQFIYIFFINFSLRNLD